VIVWLLEQHPAVLISLWLGAGGVAWWLFDPAERSWIVAAAALGLLGIGILLATAFLVPVGSQIPALAIGGLLTFAAFGATVVCALLGVARRLIAPLAGGPSRLDGSFEDRAP
jgi:hypothetical protein